MNTLKCLLVMMLSASLHSARAQDIFDKVDKLLNKTEKASNQTDRAGKTAGKLGKLFGKKEKSDQKLLSAFQALIMPSCKIYKLVLKAVAELRLQLQSSTKTVPKLRLCIQQLLRIFSRKF
ncbi:hypothetical protein KUH03_18570 [Sphingobacterium sp. E70]|uniref:hypothetical protein n=1 Tax=Sphingobacterium sp. E70 TaxID=2853439 RepID=UPI00211C2B46|nr:hypothetical protein [Sphingobacterium sp. E70]ULT28389.1 hypothetical protein KUH03_18570 [Sphingobacterium sp. E70]